MGHPAGHRYDPIERPEHCGRIALVLQGGGALGAYQAGVYQSLHEAGLEPDWVSGVSIGAINAALIAGNKDATSFYDVSLLRQTLEELINLEVLNEGEVHFAVGAVNVQTGNFVFFDNRKEEIRIEHIMASGALPPAFPMVQIGTDYFWDGGIVSNTPLQHLLAQPDNLNSLVFQVDLFSARGALPRTMSDVLGRHKEIMYSSRTRQVTDMFARLQRWKTRCYEAMMKIPPDQLSDEDKAMLESLSDLPRATILQLIYQQKNYEGNARDYEFSADSMHEHWKNGHEDTVRSLKRKDWLEMPPKNVGVITHDVHRQSEDS